VTRQGECREAVGGTHFQKGVDVEAFVANISFTGQSGRIEGCLGPYPVTRTLRMAGSTLGPVGYLPPLQANARFGIPSFRVPLRKRGPDSGPFNSMVTEA
jgi:hypothetical protein